MADLTILDAGGTQQNFFRTFLPWTPWAKRKTMLDGYGFKAGDYSGVYLLAHFDGPPPEGPVDHRAKQIIYVGETSRLFRRWDQFERSAVSGLDGHSGGHSYRRDHGAVKWEQLHLAALPIWFGDEKQPHSSEDWTQAYRLYVERHVIWELTVQRGGVHGLLNRN